MTSSISVNEKTYISLRGRGLVNAIWPEFVAAVEEEEGRVVHIACAQLNSVHADVMGVQVSLLPIHLCRPFRAWVLV